MSPKSNSDTTIILYLYDGGHNAQLINIIGILNKAIIMTGNLKETKYRYVHIISL